MPKVTVLDMAGKEVSKIDLSDAVFGIEPNKAVMHDMVKNYLPLLTAKECEVVLCLYVNQLSTADTAQKMNLAPETVRWHKKNALQKIRKAMEGNT